MEKTSSSGIGVTGLIQVAFIVLKLCKVINWKWLWVLAPTWIAGLVIIIVTAVTVVIERKRR